MIQHHNHYHVEKMMQFREAEIHKGLRTRHYAQQAASRQSERDAAADCPNRGFWHRWFGGRRLGTS